MALLVLLLVFIFVSSDAYSVTYSYEGTSCSGLPNDISVNEEICASTGCGPDGPDSTIVRCGPIEAIVVFTPSADAGISGTVRFTQLNSTFVTVALDVTGITTNPNGQHGMHVHQWGDLRGFISGAGVNVTKAAAVGSHWNPSGNNHSCPENTRHDGDLGNWDAVGGVISQTKEISGIALVGANSIIGHAVVLHATVDDCANTLSAGARLATGVVGIANVAGNLASADPFSTVTNAVCVFTGTTLNNRAIGTSGFVQLAEEGAALRIQAQVLGIPGGIDNQVGFHSHVWGDISDATGASVGGHWNMDGYDHGLPTVNLNRHIGDFGTIRIVAGDPPEGLYNYLMDDYNRPQNLRVANFIGHAIVIHADIDHGFDSTCPNGATNGDSGARALFCVLGIPNPTDPETPGFFLENLDIDPATLNNTWANTPCPEGQGEGEGEEEPEAAPTTEEVQDAMNDAAFRAEISEYVTTLNPSGAVEVFGEPETIGNSVHWTITIIYDALLSDVDQFASESALRQKIALALGTDIAKVIVVFELVDDNVFVGRKRAIQAVAYDAVVTVSGAASVVASALMSLVFLALFI